jgi:DNA-binding NtrC family response regulator
MGDFADGEDRNGISAGSLPPAVLIVEDEELVRISNCDKLEQAGLSVLEAADADQAMALLEAHPEIRVLVTDVRMPGWMSGIDLARQAEKRWPEISIIVTSAFYTAGESDLPENMTLLPKPFAPEKLLNQVRLLLRR